MDSELPIESLRIERADGVRVERRGVVDQQCQPPDGGGGRRYERRHDGMIGQIRAHHGGSPARSRDLIAQAFRVRSGAVRLDGNRVTRLMQGERDRTADAARGSGHQCGVWNLIRHFSARASW